MKLTVEINDKEFSYAYEIGGSKQTATRQLCADSLILFSKLVQFCHNHYSHLDKEFERELAGKAWLEKQGRGGE